MGIIPNMNDDLELDERGHARQRARPRAGKVGAEAFSV
jgi:hypothetical protein